MKRVIAEIGMSDRLVIYLTTMLKIIRGIFVRVFLKKSSGMLFVGSKSKISHKRRISVGKNVKFENCAEIQGLAKRGLSFGDGVTIGAYTMIRPSSYYGIDLGEGLEMGDNSSIGPLSYIGCAGYIKIGKNVMIGPKVSIFAENHVFADKDITIKEQGTVRKGITINDNCWIGSNVIILDGVTIGEGSVIGAGAIIAKDIPAHSKVIDIREKRITSRF